MGPKGTVLHINARFRVIAPLLPDGRIPWDDAFAPLMVLIATHAATQSTKGYKERDAHEEIQQISCSTGSQTTAVANDNYRSILCDPCGS